MEQITNILNSLKEIAPWLAILGGSIAVEVIPPIKLKPWSWIAKWIGKAINGNVISELNGIKGEIGEIKKQNKQQDDERMLDKALDARRRILQFADEIRRGVRHSYEHFTNVSEDITFYEKYCDDHPKFENDRAKVSIKIINDTYERCIKENDFL